MNPSKVLRIAVISEIALEPVSLLVSFWADDFLPSEVISLEQNQKTLFDFMETASMGPGSIAFTVVAVAMVGCWIGSIVGLLKLKRWGAWLYLAVNIVELPLFFMNGFDVRHPIVQVFDEIVYFFPGFIIALAFFSGAIPKADNKLCAPSIGG